MLYKAKYLRRKKMHRRPFACKAVVGAVAVALLVGCLVGDTVAWLTDNTVPFVNTFYPGEAGGEIEEEFENNIKTSIRVHNTSNFSAYIRVKLVSYMKDENGNTIGGTEKTIDDSHFDLTAWMKGTDGCYYYRVAVSSGDYTGELIETPIKLEKGQVVEVLAEAFQATPETAVENAWGITVGNGLITSPEATAKGAE